jgi:prepilin-type processing-associated H-X9-DG protein
MALIMDVHYYLKEGAERSSCQDNLKELEPVCWFFANENHGMFPRLSSAPGCLMFETKDVYPKYLKEPRNLVCPSQFTEAMGKLSPGLLVNDQSYFYLGYLVSNDAEVESFCEVYRHRMTAGQPMDGDITVPKGKGTKGGETLYRLCEGFERFLITDINNPGAANVSIPILIEWPKRPPFGRAGGNILFADGHSEYENYPGRWPMTERTVQALEQIHALQQEQK